MVRWMDDQERRRTNRATLERALAAVGAADYVAMASIYTEDYVLELPYAEPEPVRLQGFKEIGTYLGPSMKSLRFSLELTTVHECLDPDLLIAEYTSQGEETTTGKPCANVYIGVWRFRGGQVCGVKEFYNPQLAQRALTAD